MATSWIQSSAHDIATAVKGGDARAVDIAQAHLDHIEKVDGSLQAFVDVWTEGALTRAEAIDTAVANGEEVGPLAGVPVGLKDLLCTTDGTEALRAGGPKGPYFRRVRWDVSQWKGQVVFLRVVDRKTAGWGHVTLDDFSAQGAIQPTADHSPRD